MFFFHNIQDIFFLKLAENLVIYFDVWIAQKIAQNAENHIFEVLDFQFSGGG